MSSPAAHPRPRPVRDPRPRLPRLAGEAVERARLRVVPHAPRPPARVPFLGLVALVLLTGVVGLLLFNTSLQQASFAATALEAQAGTLTAREQALRMEVAEQRDPQRIAERAQAMGMVIPTVPTFLTLDGEVRGEQVPAAPTDRFAIEPAPAPNPYLVAPPATPRPDQTGADDGRAGGSDGAADRAGAPGRGTNDQRADRSGTGQRDGRSAQR